MPPLDTLQISMDQKVMEKQREEEERRRELAQDLVQYWVIYQRTEDSHDADINYKHQEGPGASVINPESLGAASMQVFQVQHLYFRCLWLFGSFGGTVQE